MFKLVIGHDLDSEKRFGKRSGFGKKFVSASRKNWFESFFFKLIAQNFSSYFASFFMF